MEAEWGTGLPVPEWIGRNRGDDYKKPSIVGSRRGDPDRTSETVFIKLRYIHTRRGGRASQEAILQDTTRECSCSTNYTHAELHSRVSLFYEQLHSRVSHFLCDMTLKTTAFGISRLRARVPGSPDKQLTLSAATANRKQDV